MRRRLRRWRLQGDIQLLTLRRRLQNRRRHDRQTYVLLLHCRMTIVYSLSFLFLLAIHSRSPPPPARKLCFLKHETHKLFFTPHIHFSFTFPLLFLSFASNELFYSTFSFFPLPSFIITSHFLLFISYFSFFLSRILFFFSHFLLCFSLKRPKIFFGGGEGGYTCLFSRKFLFVGTWCIL